MRKRARIEARKEANSSPAPPVNYDTTKKLNARTRRAGKTDTVAVVRSVSGCGHKATKSRGSTQAASNCVSPKKRLSNVGSSKSWRIQKRAKKKDERLQGKLDKVDEKIKKNRIYRHANPRFL